MSSEVSRIEARMKLISGEPMNVGGIEIKPLTLGEIASMGYGRYQQALQTMAIDLDMMIDSIEDFEFNAMMRSQRHLLKTYDMLMMSEELRDMTIDALRVFLRNDELEVDMNEVSSPRIYIDEELFIDRENYDDIADVINMQNDYNPEEDDEEYNPSNDVAQSIIDKIKRGKEIASKSKNSGDNDKGIDIVDVISAVTGKSNSLNKINIWDYTVYQLYEEFSRLILIDNYEAGLQASVWGADIEIEHWSEPI